MEENAVSQLARLGDVLIVRIGDISVKTTLQGFLDDGRFLTQIPFYALQPVDIADNVTVRLHLPRQSCAYGWYAVKEHTSVRDGVPLYQFRAVSEPERIQRRRAYRLAVSLSAEVVPLTEKGGARPQMGVTVDISEKGLCFVSGEAFETGSKLRLKLDLAEDGVLMLHGEVVRSVRAEEQDRYMTGVCFGELSQWKQAYLLKFIMKRQLLLSRDEARLHA